MKSYGRKIIDYIFKRWAERSAICYEPERKVQADSDRSDIRVFETGLSSQQYGDNRQKHENCRGRGMPLYQFSWVVLKSSKKDKAHFLLFLLFRLHGFEGVDGERGGDNI